jgi:hypothetical protein
MLSHDGADVDLSDFPEIDDALFFDFDCGWSAAEVMAGTSWSAFTSFDFSRMDRRLRMTHSRVGPW